MKSKGIWSSGEDVDDTVADDDTTEEGSQTHHLISFL